MKRIIQFFFFILISLALSNASFAQIRGGNSLSVIAPTTNFINNYAVGVSFNGDLEIPLKNSFWGTIETGYQSWQPNDLPNGDKAQEENSFSVGLGIKSFSKTFFYGTEVNYYMGDFSEFTIKANTGLRLGKFNIEANVSLLDPIPFISFELGYFWARNKE